MADTNIQLRDVSLCYRLARERIPTFKEYAIHWLRRSLTYHELWALRDVSLVVGRGESVGIVGRNGAGKSTLLKLVAGVLEPTRGRLEVRGSVSPLLELGTGFDSELSGLENVYLTAILLGRTRREIDAKLEEILAFAELGDLIHSPLRNYSTGMVSRLAFSIATAWTPDILLVDEVLSVGDRQFQDKCADRLQGFRDDSTTLLLVSHDADAIAENCRRCVWIDQGVIRADGPPGTVLDQYRAAV